jgi:hypothetical protein
MHSHPWTVSDGDGTMIRIVAATVASSANSARLNEQLVHDCRRTRPSTDETRDQPSETTVRGVARTPAADVGQLDEVSEWALDLE